MPTQQQEIEFGDLLNRNCQTINSICLRYCGGNAFYFDELRQECAVAIWAEFSRYGLDRFRGDSAESTWIYQISYHAVIDYLHNPNHQEFQSICDLYGLEPRRGTEHFGNEINDSEEYLTDNPSLVLSVAVPRRPKSHCAWGISPTTPKKCIFIPLKTNLLKINLHFFRFMMVVFGRFCD